MSIFLSSAWQRTALLFSFFFLTHLLNAQTTCSVTGPSMACVDGMSTYHVAVTGSTPYNVEWRLVPATSGTLEMSGNSMTMVHWLNSGTAQVIADIKGISGTTLLSSCSFTVNVMTFPNPEIISEYTPDLAGCVTNGNSQGRLEAYCAGSVVTFSPNGGGGTYEWTVSGNYTSQQVDPVTHKFTIVMGTGGSVKVKLKETNAAGCSRETSADYQIYEPPVSSFKEISHPTPGLITVCKGEDLLFFGNFSDPNALPIGGWFWTVTPAVPPPPGTPTTVYATGSEQQFTYTFNQSGTYKVNLYTTNCLGCTSPTTSVTVEVKLQAGPLINCPSVVCQSATPVQYCVDQSLTCGSYSWSVNGGTPQGSTTASCFNAIWNAPLSSGYGFVTLQVASCTPDVCTLPVTVEVPVIPPQPIVTGPTGVCNPNAQTLRYSVPYWPGATYTWTKTIDQNSSGGTVTIVGSGHEAVVSLNNFYGQFHVHVAISHPVANCSAAGDLGVLVQNYQITGTGGCYGSEVNLAIDPPPAMGYKVEWRVVETNAPAILVANSPSVTIPFSAFGSSGVFTVKAAITTGNGQTPFECDDLIRQIMIADEVPPVTAIQGPRKFCIPSTQVYTGAPVLTGTNLNWSVVGGNVDGSNPANSVKINWTATQPLSLTVIRTTAEGCASAPYTVSDFTNITGQLPVISGPTMPCEGGQSLYVSDIDGASSYTWSIEPYTAGSIVGGAGTSQVQILWHSFGNATVKLTARICNMNYMGALPVQVIHNSVAIICPSPNPTDCRLCQGEEYIFTTTNNIGTYYKWYLDGDIVPITEGATAKTFTTHFAAPGTHFIRVEMTGPTTCPGTFGDVLSVEVVANPKPEIFPSTALDCANLTPLTLNSTTWPGAIQEDFSWTVNTQAINNTSPTAPIYANTPLGGAQVTINSNNKDDYLQIFSVNVIRTLENDLICTAQASYLPECAGGQILPLDNTNVIFADWNFNLDIPSLDCEPDGANVCGHIIVTGDLNKKTLGDVDDIVQWVVQDPAGTVDPNPYEINPTNEDDLKQADLSIFSRAGFYPTALRVRFIGDANIYSDVCVLEIPVVPDISYTYTCGGTPGTYSLTLRDASETVPNAIIHQRTWAVKINGGATQIITANLSEISLPVPAGATVDASLTAFTHTVGPDKPGMLYYCTRCISINLPPSPTIEITADRTKICTDVAVHFSAVPTPLNEPIISYSWNFGDGTIDHSTNPTRTYVSPGNYVVTLTATTQRGCELMVTMQVEVLPVNPVVGTIVVHPMDCQSSAELVYTPDNSVPLPTDPHYLWSPDGQTTDMIKVYNSGIYALTVTDQETGCKLSLQSPPVTLQSLFPGGIQGPFTSCVGTPLMFTYTTTVNYTYMWETNLPGTPTGNKFKVSGAPAGSYQIKVTAYDFNHNFCTSVMENVVIHPLPTPPTLQVDYQDCQPFIAHITTVPNQSVGWMGPNGNIGFGTDIFVNEGGSYGAVLSNQFGCEASSSILVKDAIDVSILSGCYTICDTLLKKQKICLPAPAGSYTSWSWVLLPNTTIKSGTGPVDTICLDASKAGKLVLIINQQYHNTNPPPSGSDLNCSETSDPFCLTVQTCNACPSLILSYHSTLGGGGTPVICGAFTEHVYAISGYFGIPAGFKDCGNPPALTGGYFHFDYYALNPLNGNIDFNGFLHVTDFTDFANGGLDGTILLCDKVTGLKCPATLKVPNIPCMPGMDFNCDPGTTSTIWGPWTTSQPNNKVKVRYCFNLHYVNGSPCSVTQYTATISAPTFPNAVLAQQIFTSSQIPSDQYQCMEFLIDAARWNAYGGCANVGIQSNCTEMMGCSVVNFCGHYTYGGGGGGLEGGGDDRSFIASGNVPPDGYLNVMPNPTSEFLTVTYNVGNPTESARIVLANGLGQTVRILPVRDSNGLEQIDVSTWPEGLYFVYLLEAGHLAQSKKVVVQH